MNMKTTRMMKTATEKRKIRMMRKTVRMMIMKMMMSMLMTIDRIVRC